MAVDKRLLEILACPVTKTALHALSRDRLAILNRQIGSGEIRYADGTTVEGPLEEALITADGRTVYPVEDGIPVLLAEKGIAARQVPGW